MVAIKKFVRINEQIRSAQVRVIGPAGEQLGIIPIQKALESSRQYELDLVEVASGVVPPVCRIMDFSKFKYEQERKEREAKKHQRQVHLKEVRFKPNIEEHDYQVKLKQVIEFLKKGDRVKIGMFFRGREMSHQELGTRIINRLLSDAATVGQAEKAPTLEGRVINTVLIPK